MTTNNSIKIDKIDKYVLPPKHCAFLAFESVSESSFHLTGKRNFRKVWHHRNQSLCTSAKDFDPVCW